MVGEDRMVKDYGKVISTKQEHSEKVNHVYEGYVRGIPFRDIPKANALAEAHKNLMQDSEISEIEARVTFEIE